VEEGEGKGRQKQQGGRVASPFGDTRSGCGGGKGREKGKEWSLGWGFQALLFPLQALHVSYH